MFKDMRWLYHMRVKSYEANYNEENYAYPQLASISIFFINILLIKLTLIYTYINILFIKNNEDL